METKTPAVDSKKPVALYYNIYTFEFSNLWIIRVSAAMTVEKEDVKLFDKKRSDSYQHLWDF